MKSEPKKKNRANPFPPHVVGSGEEIKQHWRGRQAVVKAEIKHRSDPFLPFGFPLYLRLMIIKWCGVVCVTFKFVCFDGIEGKNLADEVLRKKKEKERGRRRALWNILGLGGSGMEKERKEREKENSKGTCVKEKKRGKKEKGKKKEMR